MHSLGRVSKDSTQVFAFQSQPYDSNFGVETLSTKTKDYRYRLISSRAVELRSKVELENLRNQSLPMPSDFEFAQHSITLEPSLHLSFAPTSCWSTPLHRGFAWLVPLRLRNFYINQLSAGGF